MKQGTRANYTGNSLEEVIYNALIRKGYQFVDRSQFEAARYLDQPVFTAQHPIAKSVYETNLFCDFIIYHPEKHSECLVIESKWQQSAGSVDEKFPFLVLNIRKKYPCATIVVLDGGGYKEGAEKWLRDQVDEKLVHVFNMMEFQKWSNSEEL
ncbi:PD-(D/E)XK nuclease superfamily protein [Patescibacteria group bacterium]